VDAAIDRAAQVFVERSMVALVATLSPKLRPFMTPLWFVVDGGVLYITTGTQSWAGRNVSRHPHVTLLFGAEPGMPADRILRLHGTATCHEGSLPFRVLLRVAAKYYLAPRALLSELRHVAQWGLRMRYYRSGSGSAGYIKIVPTAAEFLDRP
jgi:hypothetical protein